MDKTVVAFLDGNRRGLVVASCPGAPPNPPSRLDFEAEARRMMVAAGTLSDTEGAATKFVVQD